MKKSLSEHNGWFKDIKDTKFLEKGFVQIYTGDGKGKTTAAIGLSVRAAGHGLKTMIIQFLKGGKGDDLHSGEVKSLQSIMKCFPLIEIMQVGRPCFINKDKISEKDIALNQEGFAKALDIATNESDIGILILDEINVAVSLGIIKLHQVLELIKNKRSDLELILTGRYAPKELIEVADLVTEMKEIKHYYNADVPARVGIEK